MSLIQILITIAIPIFVGIAIGYLILKRNDWDWDAVGSAPTVFGFLAALFLYIVSSFLFV